MATPIEAAGILLKLVEQHWEELRHTENQRERFSAITTGLAVALVAAQIQVRSNSVWWFVGVAIAGSLGVLATLKFYERFHFLQSRLEKWYTQIDKLAPEAHLLDLRREAREVHGKAFPVLTRLPVRSLWLSVHAITVLAAVLGWCVC